MEEEPSPPTEPGEKSPPSNLPNFQFSGTGHAPTEDPTSPTSVDDDEATNAQGTKAPAPAQKRRRVTRACDECRRKKIKCDGKQPCTHCTVYSYECTYDQPSNRKRNPTPQYIENLETRLQRAETLLKTFLPNIDLNDPSLPTSLAQIAPSPKPTTNASNQAPKAPTKNGEAEKDSLLESMVQDTGSLDLDDEGHWDFHGHSSGMVFLQRLKQQFGDMLGSADGITTMLAKPRYFTPTPNVFDSPKSSDSPLDFSGSVSVELPEKEHGYRLCELTMSDACSLMRFLHKPTFWIMFHKIYDTPVEQWGNEEHRYLPLLYALMAVGTMFAKDEDSRLQKEGYVAGLNDGFKWFRASRQLMDITDCRDLPSLQAIICMIMFLQSTAKLSTCWCYVGIALHSAIRMGLHRSISGNFNMVELQSRRRLFWQIRKMDLYVGAMIGLPTMLNDDDIDQELPMDIDDEFITPERILPAPSGYVHLIAGSNAQTRLLAVLRKVIKYVYPIKGIQYLAGKPRSYVVSHAKIREIERDLQRWMEELPMYLRPGGDVSPDLARVQQLLRMAYAYVQMFLYRPFLHYVSRANHQPAADKRSYACAAACVSVSRNVIHITQEMSRRGLLIGSFWFVMYTTFLAIMSLVFFALENPESKSSEEIMQDAITGKEILARLAKGSMAADRCTGTLKNLFDKLPERLKRGRTTSLPISTKRKSQAVSPSPDTGLRGGNSGSDVKIESKNVTNSQRASTFPTNTPVSSALTNPSTFPKPFPTADPYSNILHQDDNAFTPQSATDINTPETQTSDSATFSQFGLRPSTTTANATANFGLADLSAMMFPSPDPFAYPNNQPMTTLEDNAFANSPPGSSGNPSANGTRPGSNGVSSPTNNLFGSLGGSSRSGNNSSVNVSGPYGFDPAIEAHIFDPLQPFLNSGYQQGMGDMGLALGDLSGMSGSNSTGVKTEDQPFGDWWAQSAGAQGGWTL